MTLRITFCKLIEHYKRIEIPLIQRDYAQGRKDQRIVRDDFLNALHSALCLPKEDPTLPLNLDFVYGSVVNDSFQPLDGQQRLTTLFLLHWYLAWVDGCSDDLRSRIINIEGELSRFSYQVRPSSREFINAFANYVPSILATDCPCVIRMISDQPWYFRRWQFDPTVRAVLSMLDQMHRIFRKTTGLYDRLIDEATPAITFQLLDLKQFDLSDDLYIKMNARGKPLTQFETFKARFEKHLKNQFESIPPDLCNGEPLADFFSKRIDTRWSDFFWPFRDKETDTFDVAVMNLLRTVIMVTRDPAGVTTSGDLADLRSQEEASSYSWFHEKGWLDHEMTLALITFLQRWSAGGETFRCYLPDTRSLDEKALFQEIISRPTEITFQKLAQLAGYTQFLVHSHGEIDSLALDAWMRVVSNLAANTEYNRPDNLRRSFAGLRNLVPQMNDILSHLASSDGDVQGFRREQVAEERIKAHLINLGDGWPELIDLAERHSYFKGQIGFLLHCCGLNLIEVDAEIKRLDGTAANDLVEPFKHYFACAAQMFDELINDPASSGRRWECALLAEGDFLPSVGRNHSLLTTASDEPWGWKRLLRNAATGGKSSQILKALWDRLERPESYAADLAAIIDDVSDIEPWREAILATPSVYDYGQYRMMRFDEDGGVYLLKKSQMNGRHVELFTYCLYESLAAEMEPYGFTTDLYESTSTEDEPGLYLARDFNDDVIELYLTFGDDGAPDWYELYLEEPQKPKGKLRAILERVGFEKKKGYWTKDVKRSKIKSESLALARAFVRDP